MATKPISHSFANFAIVILNWNGQEFLAQFLPSVLSFSQDAKIYVIDNASTDNSVEWLAANFPKISVVKLTKNLGYAGGYQKGLKVIHEDYYCLLNSDVEVTKDWLKPIKKLFDNHQEIAAIQPKILDYKKRDYFEYAGAGGGFIDKFGYPYCRGRIFDHIEQDKGQYNDEIPVFWASGACLFVRKKDYWQAGGLDKDYFAHQEEIDLCWRLHNLNRKVFYTGKSTVYHVGGASLSYTNPKKLFLNFRNSLFSILKNHKGVSVIYILFIRMLLDGVAAVRFLFQKNFKLSLTILKAHLSFYVHLPQILKKRENAKKKPRPYFITSIVFDYFVKKNVIINYVSRYYY
ncbi:glycosyltransferase family 2 protein [Aquimarina agarivorans]|uniref:glycosyltransferase family 2 protein n=1 Tax=Aquimarina agarivorans TaxID=980584 RepID=UPI000248F2ED|nr:glycosyltransferase family 2 protein [Aquimarina agarivorans]